MKKFILPLFLSISISSFSQKTNFCGQYLMEQKILQQDASIKTKRDSLEIFTADYSANYFSRLHQNQINSDTILFVIPVVFHIMHEYGVENISKAQILNALSNMNVDYQKLNADTAQVIPFFHPIIGDVQVEFRLAKIDPQGNCTDGITRHYTHLTNGGDDLLKSIVDWPQDKYLNIWVEKTMSLPAAAYAYYPGSPPILDGIVITHDYVGIIGTASTNNLPHLLSHEAGHSFNLYHMWGSSNTPELASNCNIDDGVFDTPNTQGTYSCNLYQAICDSSAIENVQNIMDYSPCPHMFTEGQVARIHACLSGTISNRNNLWLSTNLLLTGTNDGYIPQLCLPIADFENKTIRICEGDSVKFINQSYSGEYNSINWQFTGGNVTASTDTNPTVTYNLAGDYDVTLTLSNSAGTSTLTRTALVRVLPASPIILVPLWEDFETLTFPSATWSIENLLATGWAITNAAAVSGAYSIFLQNDSANIATDDIFYTEGYNFSNLTIPSFNFKLAFTNRNSSSDNLKVFMSTDCGQTWNMRYSKSGNSLTTATSTAQNFIPAANQWRQEGASINAAAGQSNVSFKLQFTTQGGNNIFIDDINIGGVTGLNDLTADAVGLTVSPNPTSDQTTLSFELFNTADVSYTLVDAIGRIVFETSPTKYSDGKQNIVIKKYFNSGVYFIKLRIKDQQFVKKIIFQN